MAEEAALPSLEQARAWVGLVLDDADGREAGRVSGLYADAESGAPVWLAVTRGRRRRTKTVVVPLRECAAMPGRAWTAQRREMIGAAPAVDPRRPLLREHEATICEHYGIGPSAGRHAEITPRPAGAITAQPA